MFAESVQFVANTVRSRYGSYSSMTSLICLGHPLAVIAVLTMYYRMLEDPSHQDVARWGKDGDTFVVVEVRLPRSSPLDAPRVTNFLIQGEKFTRSILPKHFKHSNMSSFIRQLNKYDFHKVKPSSDADGTTPNGNVGTTHTAFSTTHRR